MVTQMSQLNAGETRFPRIPSRAVSPTPNAFVSPLRQRGCGPELVLIRGLPGSGKSTIAKELAVTGFEHFEADMFFPVDGVYRYEASRIRHAHTW